MSTLSELVVVEPEVLVQKIEQANERRKRSFDEFQALSARFDALTPDVNTALSKFELLRDSLVVVRSEAKNMVLVATASGGDPLNDGFTKYVEKVIPVMRAAVETIAEITAPYKRSKITEDASPKPESHASPEAQSSDNTKS